MEEQLKPVKHPKQARTAHPKHTTPREPLRQRSIKMLGWGLLLAVSFLGSQLIVTLVFIGLAKVGVVTTPLSTVALLAMRVASYVVMAGLIIWWLWLREKKLSAKDTGLNRMLQWGDIGMGLAGVVVYLILTVTALTIAAGIQGFDPDQKQDVGIAGHLFGGELLFGFIVFVVLTPLFEEIIFRGFIYGRMRRLQFSWWVPALVVSVLFGIAHGQWNVGIDVFCLSMVACALRELTGSIWAGVLLHTAKNFVAFMLTFVFIQGMTGL